MYFHDSDGAECWNESACYRFSSAQIDALEAATYALDKMCLAAVDFAIARNRFDEFGIPRQFHELIRQSWNQDELSICGRFDLAYDGQSPPKLLEYNADTPTALLEASVIQWHWLQDAHPNRDQFNSLHERIIDAWRADSALARQTLYFACVAENLEDYMTVNYLRDTAVQAGLRTEFLPIDRIGLHPAAGFVDLADQPIRQCFKLYPWEWMTAEQFAPALVKSATRWLEPPWKMLLSNKAILPLLWQLFPGNPYLLEASLNPLCGDYVRKPLLSREGANVALMQNNRVTLETDGEYGAPFVYQRYFPLPDFDGNFPVVGSWMVNGHAAGIGIREDRSPITRNTSRFVPHFFE